MSGLGPGTETCSFFFSEFISSLVLLFLQSNRSISEHKNHPQILWSKRPQERFSVLECNIQYFSDVGSMIFIKSKY